MEYQADLSTPAPIDKSSDSSKAINRSSPPNRARMRSYSAVGCAPLIHRMVMDERNIEVIAHLLSAMNFVIVLFGPRKTRAQTHARPRAKFPVSLELNEKNTVCIS